MSPYWCTGKYWLLYTYLYRTHSKNLVSSSGSKSPRDGETVLQTGTGSFLYLTRSHSGRTWVSYSLFGNNYSAAIHGQETIGPTSNWIKRCQLYPHKWPQLWFGNTYVISWPFPNWYVFSIITFYLTTFLE